MSRYSVYTHIAFSKQRLVRTRTDLYDQSGKNLSITATGTLHDRVEPGAKVHIQVKYGLITLINQEADLCDQVKNVDLKCPLEKGKTTLTKEVDLPRQIPPGKYTVLADVFTEKGEKITCLTAHVWFNKPGGSYDELRI